MPVQRMGGDFHGKIGLNRNRGRRSPGRTIVDGPPRGGGRLSGPSRVQPIHGPVEACEPSGGTVLNGARPLCYHLPMG